ncbi:hypothetical protein ALC60_06262 [Trachymyrmex zeteki]|uniref:Uncharacterized protein n=1 Tax=Mycetomoellerius zeteki TaxID=64791 RepID=A0A151X3F4_9HYME|nr:hypothetical protein ALC60_06262 [Trachymyrmex zeteki]
MTFLSANPRRFETNNAFECAVLLRRDVKCVADSFAISDRRLAIRRSRIVRTGSIVRFDWRRTDERNERIGFLCVSDVGPRNAGATKHPFRIRSANFTRGLEEGGRLLTLLAFRAGPTRPSEWGLVGGTSTSEINHRRDTIKDRQPWANFRRYKKGSKGPEVIEER